MISADDVRRLLVADPDSVLVVVEGHASVVRSGDLHAPDYRGALQIISRAELIEQAGESLSLRELEEQASALDTAVREIGG